MGIFGPAPFEEEVEKVTSDKNTEEKWSEILDICDRVTTQPHNAKDCLKAILKRMSNNDPHVVMHAITLLDACVSNCGRPFHLEIASREFENEFKRLLNKAQPTVQAKMRQVLKGWAEGDFKTDPQLNLIPSLYDKLRMEGHDFSSSEKSDKVSAKMAAALKDPNVVTSQAEEDDIAKAIELSLKETKQSPKSVAAAGVSSIVGGAGGAYPSLYPSFTASGSGTLLSNNNNGSAAGATATTTAAAAVTSETRKVRALYDFEAAEENELTFFAGEIIHVLDDSDQNWWKGCNQRGEGLFPSNFVSADLSVDPERLDINQQNKSKKVQFDDDVRELQEKTEAAAVAAANQRVEIDESKIDRLLHLLHEANPEDPSQDSDEMLRLEQEVHQMGPLIDAELERVDRKHAQLTQLSSDLVDAINLYHSLMRDDRASLMGGAGAAGFLLGGMTGYQAANMNTQMLYGAAGYNGQQFPTTDVAASAAAQNYASLPYAGTQTVAGPTPYPPNSHYTMGAATIPMQYQNGHVNPQQQQQLNGVATNSLPTQQLYGMQQQPTQENYQQLLQQQQQQQNSQANQQQQPTTATAFAPINQTMPMPTAHQQQQPQQQFMPTQQQQQTNVAAAWPQQQQQFAATMPNAAAQPFGLPGMPPTQAVIMPQAPVTTAAAVPHHNEQFNQLQHQMAALSLSMNQQQHEQQQPTMLRNNIPIYQQQR